MTVLSDFRQPKFSSPHQKAFAHGRPFFHQGGASSFNGSFPSFDSMEDAKSHLVMTSVQQDVVPIRYAGEELAAPSSSGQIVTTSDNPPRATRAEAWSRVLGCFFVFFIVWGGASSFGVYQDYYQVDLLSTYSPSTISWIGTVQVSLLGLTGAISGPLHDRGYIRWLLLSGGFLVTFSFFMLSLAKEYYQVLLAQGFCTGLGSGTIYIPALSIVSTSFTTKRPLAIGIGSTGSAVGGIVLPIMFRHLEPQVGFGWINRIFGFLMLGLCTAAFLCLRPDPRFTRPRGPLFDASALKEPPYIVLCAGLFFVFMGYYIPIFYITPFASLSLHLSTNYSFYLLSLLNGSSIFGRVLPAFFAQKFGPATTLTIGAISLGVFICAWTGIHSLAGVTVWAVLVGFMSGLNVAIPSAVMPLLSPSPHVVGARTGMAWSGAAIAALVGSPIAGALVNTRTDDYLHGQIFGGTSALLGGILLIYPALYIWKRDRGHTDGAEIGGGSGGGRGGGGTIEQRRSSEEGTGNPDPLNAPPASSLEEETVADQMSLRKEIEKEEINAI